MKIKLTGEYKSLRDFESEELPDFTVITGKNGSGKTQLLYIFKEANNPNIKRASLIPKQRKMIQVEGIESSNFYNNTRSFWERTVKEQFSIWALIPINFKVFIQSIVDTYETLDIDREKLVEYRKLILESPEKCGFIKSKKGTVKHEKTGYEFKSTRFFYNFFETLGDSIPVNFTTSLGVYIATYLEKDLLALKEADFLKVPLPKRLFESQNLFDYSFSDICYAYSMNRYLNEQRYFWKEGKKEKNQSINPDEYNSQSIAPWEKFNILLRKTVLEYEVIGIREEDFDPAIPFGPKLQKKSTGEIIEVSELSSGEQIIFGLVMKLFISSYSAGNLAYPSLILLDEPDAHLHPELTNILISTLYDTFVLELGVKVILTTHSPSTVALSPDESIFELNNIGNCSLKWIGREKALELLTGSIPTLSIDYKNHKQVFVESETDGEYFRKIFDTLKRKGHSLNSPLYFIDNPMGKGNSDLVLNTTRKFREAGNKTVYGLIDWDKTHKPNEHTLVHGENERYTIENYLLDPIYLAVFFQEKGAHEIEKITGITEQESPYSVIELDENKLQSVADKILQKVEENFPVLLNKKTPKTIKYLNGVSIELPEWFLLSKHNELVEKFTSTYQVLAALIQKEGEGKIQKELTRVICRCYPMIPKDTVEILTHISNGK
ncbi:MAG: AAA family ATPase [Balneola sp.]